MNTQNELQINVVAQVQCSGGIKDFFVSFKSQLCILLHFGCFHSVIK